MDLIDTQLRLPAVEPEWVERVRGPGGPLADMAHAVGGPFHVLHPARFAENAAGFRRVLAEHQVPGRVYFGKKANKSGCWLEECARTDTGVDVASVPEFAEALAHGIRGHEIVVTGAAKSDRLIWLAARHGALLAVDALDELDRVCALAETAGALRILLRVLPETNPHSRFGFTGDELDEAIRRCAAAGDALRMEGFSFHLNGYEVAPRAALAAELIERCRTARAAGLPADSISIGGGFAVDYLDARDWERFHREYADSWFHAEKKFTHFYPYHSEPTGARMLAAILDTDRLAAQLRETGTRLLLEPGRALLDGCGFTVFPVQGYKPRRDYGIVTVAGLSMSISEQWKGSEYLPDPVLWPESGTGEPVSACVGGSSCLDYDMLSWRKIAFPRAPRNGDLLVYPNTAGYQMDKNETEFHQLPLPARIVVSTENEQTRWRIERPVS
ncbi:alanine racemase [Sciscionella sediminilitoris]|uniref:alanine racemase n=1 Tax=Sciscionella sediminilitoris TaxID=1445613 RepID=UPI0004DF0AC7|nr:alanine racemase [Sciscionella sp. SE31]